MAEKTEGGEEPRAGRLAPPEMAASIEVNPLALREMFPDAQGLLDARYATLADIKINCLVVLDASAMLLPYALGQITLGKVIEVYRPLAQGNRLVVPAQAVREFAKNRSRKIGDIVQHLQDRASSVVAPMKAHIGLLAEDPEFIELQALSKEVGELAKRIQTKVSSIVDRISAEIGGDPVSEAYREVFKDCVRDEAEPVDEAAFKKEMAERYASRRPPGYKDKGKPDGGAGDFLIWQTVLRAGEAEGANGIFVTADVKSDWYTQSNGAFQPRLELVEEYRVRTGGRTLHIVPLSRLLELYDAGDEAIAETRDAERSLAKPAKARFHGTSPGVAREEEWLTLLAEQEDVSSQIQRASEQLGRFGDDFNTSLSLPWNRAMHSTRVALSGLRARAEAIGARLAEIENESLDPATKDTP